MATPTEKTLQQKMHELESERSRVRDQSEALKNSIAIEEAYHRRLKCYKFEQAEFERLRAKKAQLQEESAKLTEEIAQSVREQTQVKAESD